MGITSRWKGAWIWLVIATCIRGGRAQGDVNGQELLIDQIKKTVVYLQGVFPCHQPRIANGVVVLGADGTPLYETACTRWALDF